MILYHHYQRFQMRAKPERQLEAERLRREEGLSYKEIMERTGISKSTLSHWLRDIELQPEQAGRLQQRLIENRQQFAARAWPVNRTRHQQARNLAFEKGVAAAHQLQDERMVHELAFAMLYLGEGGKTNNRVEVASTMPQVLQYTLWVLRDIFGVTDDQITCRLHLIAAAESLEPQLRAWWSQQLNVPCERFSKTGYDRRLQEVHITEDYHGVCSVVYRNTYLQQYILGLAEGYIASRIK
jgi:transposase